jgi:hypothetical protein
MITRDAAEYCGYKTRQGLLDAWRRGHVYPCGQRGITFLWEREELDRFLKVREYAECQGTKKGRPLVSGVGKREGETGRDDHDPS